MLADFAKSFCTENPYLQCLRCFLWVAVLSHVSFGLVDLEHRQLRSNELGVGRSQQGADTVLAGRMDPMMFCIRWFDHKRKSVSS